MIGDWGLDDRYCGENFYNIGSNVCTTLKKRNTEGTKCIYSGTGCMEVPITCGGYYIDTDPEISCNGKTPLKENLYWNKRRRKMQKKIEIL